MGKKPSTGYKNKNNKKRSKKKSYISALVISGDKKISLMERVVKVLIYMALRLVIRPKRWKHPEKNYEIIDRTYKRIMSSDFIFIPSSIAFYIIMAFMPIITLVVSARLIPGLSTVVSIESLNAVMGRFIPGIDSVLSALENLSSTKSSTFGGTAITLITLIITTWIASGGFAKLIYTQSYIYEHKFVGGYWMNRIKGMFIVLALTLFLAIALAANIAINEYIDRRNWASSTKSIVMYIILFFGLLMMIFLGVIGLFKLSPRYKIKARHVVPGAMVVALPMTLFLSLFGLITTFWSYGTYGVIGAIMYIGMSALISSNFLFMGLIANAAYYKTFVGTKLKQKWTVSKK